jgi:hypothetical protein
MMTLNIASGAARVNAPQVRPAHLELILSHESVPGPNRTLNGLSLYHLAGQGDQHSDLMSGEALDWSQTAEIAALFAGL